MEQTLQVQVWMTTTRDPVNLTFKTHKQHFAPQVLQGSKELLGLLDITAQVLLAVKNKQGGVDVLHVCDGRHAHVTVEVFPRRRIQFIIGKGPTQIARAKVRGEVGDTAVCSNRLKAVGRATQPVCQEASIAATQ